MCLCVSRYLRLEFVPFFYFFSLLVTTTTTAANEIGSVGTKTEKKGNDDRGSADVASTTHTHFDFSLRGCVCVCVCVCVCLSVRPWRFCTFSHVASTTLDSLRASLPKKENKTRTAEDTTAKMTHSRRRNGDDDDDAC